MIRLRGPDGVFNNFPNGTPDSVIHQAMARHYGAAETHTYGGEVRTRTNANLAALQHAIDYLSNHPRDPTNAVRIPGAVMNFAHGSAQAPLAAGVDQITRPAVKAFNDALHTHYDYHGISDSLLAGLGAIMPMALEEGAAAMALRDRTEPPVTSGGATTPFPDSLIHPRLFVANGRKVALSRAGPHAPSVSREGIDLSLGQRLGGRARGLETRAASLPLVGPIVENSRRRSLESFNRAVASRALAEVDASLPDEVGAGHEAAAYLRQRIGEMVEGMTTWPDSVYNIDREMPPGAPINLSPDLQKEYRSKTDEIMAAPALRDEEDERDFDGYSGREILEILLKLGKLADEYKFQGGRKLTLGDEIDKFSDNVRALSYREQPNYIQNLPKADQANEIRYLIDAASDLSAAGDGVYTPADLMAAIMSRYSGEGQNLVSPAVVDLYQFADRANRAMGRSYDGGGSSIVRGLDSLLAGSTPETRFVAGLAKGLGGDPGTASAAPNAFDAESATAARTEPPSFLGNGLRLDPMIARAVTSPALAFVADGPRTARDDSGQK